jgi:hypothetical protein
VLLDSWRLLGNDFKQIASLVNRPPLIVRPGKRKGYGFVAEMTDWDE